MLFQTVYRLIFCKGLKILLNFPACADNSACRWQFWQLFCQLERVWQHTEEQLGPSAHHKVYHMLVLQLGHNEKQKSCMLNGKSNAEKRFQATKNFKNQAIFFYINTLTQPALTDQESDCGDGQQMRSRVDRGPWDVWTAERYFNGFWQKADFFPLISAYI